MCVIFVDSTTFKIGRIKWEICLLHHKNTFWVLCLASARRCMVPGWHPLFRNSAVTAKNAPDMAHVCSLGHYNTQTSILHHRDFQHHPLTITSHQRVGVIGCTRRLWRHSNIKPSPPVGCWSILLLRPILRSRLILFQLISINVCVRGPPPPPLRHPYNLVCKC